MENKVKIAKHNQKATKGEKSYFLKMNHFGDKLNNEVVSTMYGYRRDLKTTPAYKDKKKFGATFISPGKIFWLLSVVFTTEHTHTFTPRT